MAKLTLADLANLNNPTSAVASINANNALIEAAVENTLSLDGTSPNSMNANLDMNGFDIINAANTFADIVVATRTLVSNAGTITTGASIAQITTESLSTAAGSSQAFVITQTGVTVGTLALIQYSAGTNTRSRVGFRSVCTTDTITVTVDNHEASNALNGTLLFYMYIIPGDAS